MSLANFDLSQYPAFYLAIKIVAFITFGMGAFTMVDYCLPSESVTTPVLRTQIDYGEGRERYVHQNLVLMTKVGIIKLDPKYSMDITEDMILIINRSQILNALKSYQFIRDDRQVLEIEGDNVFGMNAFFAKFLMLSIFTLIYTNPKYWMISLTIVNVVIALIFSGIPKVYIVFIIIGSATVAFIISLYISSIEERRA